MSNSLKSLLSATISFGLLIGGAYYFIHYGNPIMKMEFYFIQHLGTILGYTVTTIFVFVGAIIALIFAGFLISWGEEPQPVQASVVSSSDPAPLQVNTPKPRRQPDLTAFDRLIGMEEARQEVQDFFDISIMAIEAPEKLKQYELTPPRGILLYGPPGTGKTAFARACARYYGYPIKVVNASQIVAGCELVGQIQQKLKYLFELVNQHAPAILFIDELDAIAQRRTGQSNNSPSQLVLPDLLTLMDGYKQNKNVFIIAATNRKDMLDEAILRPGRLEKHIFVDLPNEAARAAILKAHMGERIRDEEIHFTYIASQTEGKSGADLKDMVERAARLAFREDRGIAQVDFLHDIA